MTAYKYNGVLGKKQKISPRSDDADIQKALDIVSERETLARVLVLFEDCDAGLYDPNQDKGLGAVQRGWRKVALTLAGRHVPGFQYGVGRGRPRQPLDTKMLKEIDATLKKQKKPSARAAAGSVAKKSGRSGATLERKWRRYKNAK